MHNPKVAVVCRRATDRQNVRRALSTSSELSVVHVSANGDALSHGDVKADIVVLDNFLDSAADLYQALRAASPGCRIMVATSGSSELFSLSVPRHLVIVQEAGESMDEVVLRAVKGRVPSARRAARAPRSERGRPDPRSAGTPASSALPTTALPTTALPTSAVEALAEGAAPRRGHGRGGRTHIVLGSSTGGPDALREVLTRLPSNFPLPILIVQHMPAGFTADLAKRLDKLTRLHVREATHGARPTRGEIWIAPGDHHMVIADVTGQLALHDAPKVHACRPSVDVLFESAARAFGSRVVGVVLTGMGTDGRDGCEQISTAGGHVICQDEATSTVWGMPGSVTKAGFANEVLPLDRIAIAMLGQTLGGTKPRKQNMTSGGDQCL